MSNKRLLKMYVRYDGQGRIVAGSNIWRQKMPKVGKWLEIQGYLCCNFTTSSTTTTEGTQGTTSSSTSTTSTSTTARAAVPCSTMGRASNFAVLGHETVTNTGDTVVTGDLGLSPGTSVTGFPPGIVLGTQYITDGTAAAAMIDADAAYDCLWALTPTGSVGADIGGTVITAGVYSVSSSLAITGTVTLNGENNPNAVFVFLIPSTFIPAINAIVALSNEALPCNVYWLVGSSATLSSGSTTVGNIIALASITFNSTASLIGRAFALTGAVTMDNNIVTNCECTVDPCDTTTSSTTSTFTTAETTSTTSSTTTESTTTTDTTSTTSTSSSTTSTTTSITTSTTTSNL